ncbi:RNA polymerase sigma factor [Lapillicoccus jejuensis]|nr:RNA polymerase sigma factor [Lapillicoccus jejuensis]
MATLARRLGGADWEDALQEALASAWRKREQYDAARGTPRAWLLAIVADRVRGARRRRLPEPVGSPDDLADQVGGDAPSGREMGLDLRAALATLTYRQRVAVEMHYYAGLTVADVATVLGCAEGTVKSTLSDARGHLRRRLGEEYR